MPHVYSTSDSDIDTCIWIIEYIHIQIYYCQLTSTICCCGFGHHTMQLLYWVFQRRLDWDIFFHRVQLRLSKNRGLLKRIQRLSPYFANLWATGYDGFTCRSRKPCKIWNRNIYLFPFLCFSFTCVMKCVSAYVNGSSFLSTFAFLCIWLSI